MSWFLMATCGGCCFLIVILAILPAEWKDMPILWGMSRHGLVLNIGGLSMLGLVVYGIYSVGKRHEKVCPHCKKSIQGVLTHIAIATGKCGQCGEMILEDPCPPSGK